MALPQPLHIFRKDLMHLWPETLTTLLLIVAFAWAAPSGWSQSPYAGVATLLAGLLKVFLIPISWLVVISRLIHDETLVGDRQFWTSRPYHWASLLAAKLLYMLAFIYLPFFLMQVFLLKHAGLYPTTVIPSLLHNLLLLTVIIVVPLAALAAVTGTFARMLLSTIGAVIYMLVISLLVLWLIFRQMAPPGLDTVLIAIFILLPMVALVYQYATRKTTISRVLLAATPLLIALLLFATPAKVLIEHAYPVSTAADAPKLSALPDNLLPKEVPSGKLLEQRGEVLVGIPVTVAGVDSRSNYIVKGVAAVVDAPGVHWTSPYMNSTTELGAFRPMANLNVAMPLDVFNKIGKSPADVHLSLAAEHPFRRPAYAMEGDAAAVLRPRPRSMLVSSGRSDGQSSLPLSVQNSRTELRDRDAGCRRLRRAEGSSDARPHEPRLGRGIFGLRSRGLGTAELSDPAGSQSGPPLPVVPRIEPELHRGERDGEEPAGGDRKADPAGAAGCEGAGARRGDGSDSG